MNTYLYDSVSLTCQISTQYVKYNLLSRNMDDLNIYEISNIYVHGFLHTY